MSLVHIAIVEGNSHLRSLLSWHLQKSGYATQQYSNPQQARSIFSRKQPALVILDADIPSGNSIELCQWLYQQRQSMILMLTNQNEEKKSPQEKK